MKRLFLSPLLLITCLCYSQVSVTKDGSSPDQSAMLDVKSTTKGVLVPRMTTVERYSIWNPATGLLVFDTDTSSFWFYDGDTWKEISGSGSASSFWQPHTNGIVYDAGKVGIGINPSPIIPLTVWMPNSNNGNAILHLRSNDIFHSALSMFNGNPGNEKEFSLVLAGPSNIYQLPGGFGIFNHQTSTFSLNFDPTTNYMAVGANTLFYSNSPKSRLHVFAGDVNIDQIGSGIIMKSPNGSCWRITINDSGNLVRTLITCPQ